MRRRHMAFFSQEGRYKNVMDTVRHLAEYNRERRHSRSKDAWRTEKELFRMVLRTAEVLHNTLTALFRFSPLYLCRLFRQDGRRAFGISVYRKSSAYYYIQKLDCAAAV